MYTASSARGALRELQGQAYSQLSLIALSALIINTMTLYKLYEYTLVSIVVEVIERPCAHCLWPYLS